jgi:hypothetical protein
MCRSFFYCLSFDKNKNGGISPAAFYNHLIFLFILSPPALPASLFLF